jgi:hypothetical protein
LQFELIDELAAPFRGRAVLLMAQRHSVCQGGVSIGG